MRGEIRRAVAVRRETERGNHHGFPAGTQPRGGPRRCAKPPPNAEAGRGEAQPSTGVIDIHTVKFIETGGG